jgi:hypothetical protein
MEKKQLHHIKDSGFKIPEGYFDALNASILAKLEDQKLLEIPNASGFKTPDDYFATLENRIQDNLQETEVPKIISITRKRTLLVYISGIAAAVCLYFSLPSNETALTFDGLETASVEDYIMDDNISSYEIAALLSEDQIKEDINVNLDIDPTQIENYLLEHADIDDLMLE